MAPEYDETEVLESRPRPSVPDHLARELTLAFRRVGERILREHPGATGIPGCHVNRCPRCGRIVVTPQARQCTWCHCDWHDAPSAT